MAATADALGDVPSSRSSISSVQAGQPSLTRPVALVVARAVSAVGDYASVVALPLIALTLIPDARVLGAALAAERVPVMLAPWWTQRLPEAWRQPRGLPVIGVLQSAAAAALPAGVWAGDLDQASGVAVVSVILVVALTLGTLDALGDALGFAALCELGELRAGGGAARFLGLDDLARRTAKLAGPALAAALAATWSPAAVLAFDSASFLLAALLTAWATRILVPSHGRPRHGSVAHPRPPATATLRSSRRLPRLAPEPVRRMLARHPQVAASWRLRGIGCFVWGGYSVGVPLLVVAIPGPDTTQLAVIASAYATAGLTASAAISIRPIEPKHLLAAAMLAWSIVGCCFIAMAAGASLIVLSAAAAVMGLSIPMANVTTTQQVAAATSGPERTLAMMTQSSVVNGASTAGLLVTGAAITILGPRPTLACGGLIVVTAALLALRQRRTATVAPEAARLVTRVSGASIPRAEAVQSTANRMGMLCGTGAAEARRHGLACTTRLYAGTATLLESSHSTPSKGGPGCATA